MTGRHKILSDLPSTPAFTHTASLLTLGLAPLGYRTARLAWILISVSALVLIWLKFRAYFQFRGLPVALMWLVPDPRIEKILEKSRE
jgi:hypothetical protein